MYRAVISSTIFSWASVNSPLSGAEAVSGASSTPNSQPTVTPNRRLRATSLSISGKAVSDSHL